MREVRMSPDELGIDQKRVFELDRKLLAIMVESVDGNSEEEIKKREKEIKEGDMLKKAYEILQDYNQMEIAFFIMSNIGATIQPEAREHMNKARAFNCMKAVSNSDDEVLNDKLHGIIQMIAMGMLKELL